MLSRIFVSSILLLTLLSTRQCAAQDSGAQGYQVNVRSQLNLEILRGPQLQNHPGTSGDLIFDNSVWRATCTSFRGCTVTFTTDGPFQHTVHAQHKRDAAIEFRQIYGTFWSGWRIDKQADQTDYQNGYDQASIQMSSQWTGLAYILMRIRFLTGDPNTLAGGNYRMTVIGTITEN